MGDKVKFPTPRLAGPRPIMAQPSVGEVILPVVLLSNIRTRYTLEVASKLSSSLLHRPISSILG